MRTDIPIDLTQHNYDACAADVGGRRVGAFRRKDGVMNAVCVIKTSDTTYPNIGRYFIAEMTAGKHAACVVIKDRGVQVVVKNASNRAWRGMGREFRSLDEALTRYKTADIRAMIQTAADMARSKAQS